ncbi:MAG: hypothetical protein JWN71_4190 [Xanthobacteraceae bacterium]|nr:hypothetical protein [Xanthobacteraceae bacterium]
MRDDDPEYLRNQMGRPPVADAARAARGAQHAWEARNEIEQARISNAFKGIEQLNVSGVFNTMERLNLSAAATGFAGNRISEALKGLERLGASDAFKSLERLGASDAFKSLERLGASDAFKSLERLGASDAFKSLERVGAPDAFKGLGQFRVSDAFNSLEQLRASSAFKGLENLRVSDAFKGLEQQLQVSEAIKGLGKLRVPEAFKALEHFQASKAFQVHLSPASSAHVEMLSRLAGPVARANERAALTDTFTRYSEQLRQIADPLANLHRQLESVARPLRELQSRATDALGPNLAAGSQLSVAITIAGQLIDLPNDMVAKQLLVREEMRAANEVSQPGELEGTSLAVDAALAERELHTEELNQSFNAFIARLAAVFRVHFERVQNFVELINAYQLVTLIIAAASLYYTMQSADKADVDKVTEAVRDQTKVLREEFRATRDAQQQLHGLACTAQEMAVQKAATLPSLCAYKVSRVVALKSERRLKSDTVAFLFTDQVVFLRGRDKKWVMVEAIDWVTGGRVSGWVVKKNLKLLK